MLTPPEAALLIIVAADLLGVFANAFLGGVAARKARLDLVGFAVLALASGLGGGMIRDMLLSTGPALVLTDPLYLSVALAGALMAYGLVLRNRWAMRLFVVLDALAVGCWAAVGVQKGLNAGLHWLPALLLGLITSVGGGMVRDLLLRKRPGVLGGNTLYATGALVAAVVCLAITLAGEPIVASVAAIVVGGLVVLAARRFQWVLPVVRADDEPPRWMLRVPGRRRRPHPQAGDGDARGEASESAR